MVIFTSFYLVLLTNLLPRLSRILKVRAKKLSSGKEIFQDMSAEETILEKDFSRIITNTSKDSSILLQKSSNAASLWVDASLQETAGKNGSIQEVNNLYMEKILKTSADQSLLLKLTAFLLLFVINYQYFQKFSLFPFQ